MKALALLVWAAGIILAKGFWSTFFAVLTPWGYFLVAEAILQYFKIVA